MSEYQYYEFLALERSLTADEMAKLRDLSSRGRITPISFSNFYNWGNFSGDSRELMRRMFDVHVYVANWMTAVLMIRVPLAVLSDALVEAFEDGHCLEFEATKSHWVITWILEESTNYDRFGAEDGEGWMARLAPLRDELLRGDLRGLYIGWLASLAKGEFDDDDPEPLLLEGLGELTPAQRDLARFLELDEDILSGAAIGSPPLKAVNLSNQEVDAWLEALPRDEVFALLKQLMDGQGVEAKQGLRRRFLAWQSERAGAKQYGAARAVGDIRANAEVAKEERLEKERLAKERQERQRRERREAHLVALAKDFPKHWKAVEKLLERSIGKSYDEAKALLVDLADAYGLQEDRPIFSRHLNELVQRNLRRKAFVERLVKAKLWKER
ncbi:hypothetical protein [Desulfonatronum thiodismutans]|uniref:hypothetical protein n=1 Tax=Desulfonatronum thiodismutans TaxID=159290 RepID=UPI0004ABE103|nr:hypothetical protein [Desulfonatronum thiodismutans]